MISDGVHTTATSSLTSTDASLLFELSSVGSNASLTVGDGVTISASGHVSILGDARLTGEGFVFNRRVRPGAKVCVLGSEVSVRQ